MSPADLRIDVDLVEQVAGPTTRMQALRLLEATAEAAGDLALANDARYALLASQGDAAYGAARWVDTVVYRGIAGYLVRPLHPLLVLACLVVVAGVVRAAARQDRPLHLWARSRLVEGRDGRRRPSRHAVVAAGHAVVVGAHESLRRAVRLPRAPGDATAPLTARSVVLGAEAVAYAVLIGVVVLTLSNSSGTLREVLDAVRG